MGGITQRVQLGQPADIVDERVVLARLRCDRVDLVQAELETIGFLGEFPRPLLTVGQVAASGQPVIAQRAIALQLLLDIGGAVQGPALLVGTHQPELVILAVQCQQFGGEGAQRLRGHAAATKVGARRPLTADRTGRDDAAVVVTFCPRGIQHLVDAPGHSLAEFACGEAAFDNSAVSAGTHPAGVRAAAAEQVQPRDDHGLAGAGLPGEHSESAIEFRGRGADRAQRLDADLG